MWEWVEGGGKRWEGEWGGWGVGGRWWGGHDGGKSLGMNRLMTLIDSWVVTCLMGLLWTILMKLTLLQGYLY